MPRSEASNVRPFRALGDVGQIRTLNALLSRFDLAGRAGLTFGGDRDVFKLAGYQKNLEARDYRARYERLGVAERVVELYPKATWRGGFDLVEDEDPEVETDFEREWLPMSLRLKVRSVLERADILCGLGRYGVVLIGAPGKLADELPARLRPEEVAYLTPFGEEDVRIKQSELIKDTADPRAGLPEFYRFGRLFSGGATKSSRTRRVHWTRVLHVACDVLDEPLFGKPRLRSVWNDLDDLEKIRAGGAEAHWDRADPGIAFNLDPDLKLGDDEKAVLEDEIETFKHKLSRTMMLQGVEAELLQGTVSAIGPNLDAITKLVAIGQAVPLRIFTGSERGELASTQDRNNWNERVQTRRETFAADLVRELVDRLIGRKALPEPRGYEVKWFEIENLDEAEKAEVAERLAKANATHFAATGAQLITGDEIRTGTLGLPPLADVVEIVAARARGLLRRLRSRLGR